MPMASLCASCSQAGKLVTLPIRNRCWMRHLFQVCAVAQANAADGFWPIKSYDNDTLRRDCDRYRMQPVISLFNMKRKPKPAYPDCLIAENTVSATSLSACSNG
ncbi:hypothetical protein EMIT0P258_50004 [Pseudomonas sp. IT-P258]